MNSQTIPQVLFLGNGLNLAYSGISWADLIGKIAKRDDFDWSRSEMPMPLQAILASDNQIRTSLKSAKEDFRGKIRTDRQMEVLRDLLTMGFDDILTTNYSYELEEAALGTGTESCSIRSSGNRKRIEIVMPVIRKRKNLPN